MKALTTKKQGGSTSKKDREVTLGVGPAKKKKGKLRGGKKRILIEEGFWATVPSATGTKMSKGGIQEKGWSNGNHRKAHKGQTQDHPKERGRRKLGNRTKIFPGNGKRNVSTEKFHVG